MAICSKGVFRSVRRCSQPLSVLEGLLLHLDDAAWNDCNDRLSACFSPEKQKSVFADSLSDFMLRLRNGSACAVTPSTCMMSLWASELC